MDIPFLLIVLLALPIVTGAVIVAVSVARRRRRGAAAERAGEGVHRLQTDTAAVQDAAVHPPVQARGAVPGRERRAASATRPTER